MEASKSVIPEVEREPEPDSELESDVSENENETDDTKGENTNKRTHEAREQFPAHKQQKQEQQQLRTYQKPPAAAPDSYAPPGKTATAKWLQCSPQSTRLASEKHY
jgi:hypothetical protein